MFLCCFKLPHLEAASSSLRGDIESQRNCVRTHSSDMTSCDGQCPVVSDDQQLLKLLKELNDAQTQIKKIVRTHLYDSFLRFTYLFIHIRQLGHNYTHKIMTYVQRDRQTTH